MPTALPPLRLTGAISLRDDALQHRSIALSGGRFAKGPFPAVDMTGFYLMPGIVDLHAELVPQHMGPAGPDPDLIDRESALNGITTRFISLPWSWDGPRNSPEAATQAAYRIHAARKRLLTDLRLQIRAARMLVPQESALLDLVRATRVGQVVFSNDTEIAADMRREKPDAFSQRAWTCGLHTEELSKALDRVLPNATAVPRHLCRLAEAFDALGVIYGSCGDDSAETREHYSMIGARICLNPGTTRVAVAARAVGDPVVSEAGRLPDRDTARSGPTVADLLDAGLCSALASGRQSPALVQSAFWLADQGILPLEKAWALISAAPAEILRLPDRGVIAPGKRADLTIVNAATRQVEATICAGRVTFLTGEAAARFLGAEVRTGVAAE